MLPRLRKKRIRDALREGVNSIRELCRIANLRPSTFRSFCAEEGIRLSEALRPYPHWPEVDRLLKQGRLTTKEIGEHPDIDRSRQFIESYIKDRGPGEYKRWKELRGIRKEEERYAKIEEANKERAAMQRAKKTETRRVEEAIRRAKRNYDWPRQKAWEYKRSRPGTTYRIEALVGVFRRFETAKKKGKKATLEELGSPNGIRAQNVKEIINEVGLDALCWQQRHISSEERAAIRRGIGLKLSKEDIAYFLGIKNSGVESQAHKNGRRPRLKAKAMLIGSAYSNKGLTHRLASQIYQADDWKQPNGARMLHDHELTELLGTTKEVVALARENRKRFEPRLRNQLRILYADRGIKKPYIPGPRGIKKVN